MTDSPVSLDEELADARQELEAVGQAHVLDAWEQLDKSEQRHLLDQVHSVDWEKVSELVETHVLEDPEPEVPSGIEPASFYPWEPDADLLSKYEQARKRGERAIAAGEVAAFTVAGGQGTRLGWDGPKGTFPATPVRRATLFQVFAEQVRKAQEKWDTTIPWYIMTSPVNDMATRSFFAEQEYFGLPKEDVKIFPQAMMPAVDPATGRVLMADRHELALSPNGHGGSLQALLASGAIEDMAERGVQQISYTQVDNPLVKMIDPLFIGLHILDDAGMSSKALPKAGPHEKVGNFCVVNDRVQVIEYSDMPDELAEQTDEEGQLRFRAGSIAIHIIRRDFVESLDDAGRVQLPYHRADKKVPYLDLEAGEKVEPASPNAVKLEMFVFDAIPRSENSVILETDRVEEFAPIKNAEGDDSPETSRRLQVARAGRWLKQHDVEVPLTADGTPEATLEITPLTAIEVGDLADADLPERIEPGQEFVV